MSLEPTKRPNRTAIKQLDKVCDTCGDIGYETALVICKKCKVGCEHLYCMRKFYMAAPADWCCEMCKSISMDSSDCGLKKESFKAVTCDLSTKLHHGPKDFTDRKSFCKGARGNWHEKAVGTGKTKYLWTSEVKNMPSGEKKGESTCVGPVSRKPSKSIASEHNIASMKPKSIIYADSSFMVKSNPKFGPSRNSSVRSGNIQNNTSVKKVKAAAEEPLPTDPATIASWTGSFILKDEKTSISFQAHPRSQGLSKVKEFCRKMPEVLEFELCLYEDFLRTVFKGCDPDDQDIGLYFFPDDRIRPNAYISHLEQLSGNFFLRSCIDGVELLVFTSKVLHKDYRKRNKCDFLWGIYRHRHRKLKVAVEETMVVDMDIDSEEVDMEVDMIGGETVGTVDVVVPKQLTESDIDIPPGFSPSMRGQWKTKIKQEVWKF
ncbi:hypothetical protein DCAR_0311460 [Daucus carota subsp. sativus]|uniref:AIPP2-like SPOC-like domain-containing protein n=1 Tax=Daucus carota subsp. sativus TaxID=79200 RepID=A0AAF0WQB1_DAUCS|nr:hypothetical protein DCAR_0311460 [Daucus carota subsp. sativus]